MKRIFLFLFLVLLINAKTHSIDTNVVKYYPLAVGNSWTYSYVNYPYGPIYRHTERVTGTISMNSHFYYIITTYTSNGYSPVTHYHRIDSVNNNIHIYDNTAPCPWLQNEITGDSLGARIGDSSKLSCNHYYRLTDTASFSLFGTVRKGKIFSYIAFEIGTNRRYAKDIGFYSLSQTAPSGLISDFLTGCIVNGVLYGDTSLTGINLISSQIPNNFSLSQNYPNPFNPKTKIKFAIPGSSAAQTFLSVYDIQGREVTTLVNESLKPGTYEVEWDAASYPSGVYFYKLVVGDNNNGGFTETKKMVLIK